MRASDFVTELFSPNKGYPITWNGNSQAVFKTADGRPGVINFETLVDDEAVNVFVEFSVDDSQLVTGRGDAAGIFTTAVKAINQYVAAHKPEFISFEAQEPNRYRLYQRMAARLANNYTNTDSETWTSLPTQLPPHADPNSTIILARNDLVN